jgi:anti-sigma factor RsiW
VTCEDARKLLNPYADGELDVVRGVEIEDHLRECEACQGELDSLRALHGAIAENAAYYDAPDDLEARVRAAAGLSSPTLRGRTEPHLSRFGWGLIAAAAAVALVIIVIKNAGPPSRSTADLTMREVVDDHIRSLMANHLTDVVSSNQHTVKPWFDGKIDFAPQVADFSREGFVLIGGRLDYLDSHPVAAIVYRRHLHVINLFVWPAAHQANSASVAETRQGYNIVHWTKDGMAYWAVSDVELAQLEDFARMVREEAPPQSR